MRLLRIVYIIFKAVSMLYTLWRGTRATRIVWLVTFIWRLIRRKPSLLRRPRVLYTFVGADDERVYRRQGLRKIESLRKS